MSKTLTPAAMKLQLYDSGMSKQTLDKLTAQGAPIDEIYKSCLPMIEKGIDLSELESDKIFPSFFDGKKFLHNVMGDYLVKERNICKINGAVHAQVNGVYKSDESIIHGYAIELVPTLTTAQRKEVFKYIEASPYTPVRQVAPPHLIPFKTKVYNLATDTFEEYTPDKVFLNKFPYDYKPDAKASANIATAIAEIACHDSEVINLLTEAFGNCFYMLNAYRGTVMLYGPNGSNGKSTLLNMLAQLVGRENASFLSLQETAERFKLIGMYGKAVNIGDDIPEACLLDSSLFKKLSTGEEVTAERKGENPVHFRSYAKMFFSMNALPAVSDKSKAFFSRILLVPLNADFSKNKDVTMKDRQWTTEDMEYLTKLSVEGLKRLIQQGEFTIPECTKQLLAEYERENNPTANFMAEYLEDKELENMPTLEAYTDFAEWCFDNGHRNIVTHSKFTREVRRLYSCNIRVMRHSYYSARGKENGRCFTYLSAL